MGLFNRSIQPPDDIVPNPNDPASVPPATVGPPSATPGDPSGVTISEPASPYQPPPPVMRPVAWSGWPAEWWTPGWNGGAGQSLIDIAWLCINKNAKVLASMPPYLVGAAPSLGSDWLTNPAPDVYTGWQEFARQLFRDYYAVGEAFVLATARYATGWPARFHVCPPWSVNVEMTAGRRRYTIGGDEVSDDLLHIRYDSSVDDAHGHGPLEVGAGRILAAKLLAQYVVGIVQNGGVPSSVITMPENSSSEQAQMVKQQWIDARLATPGAPAVLTGGITWSPTQLNPEELGLLELARFNDARIAELIGVPPGVVGLSAGDSMTYKNQVDVRVGWWQEDLKPQASYVMEALSGWALPRDTIIELNRDEFVQPGPLERAQTAQILSSIVDPATGQQALTVQEIRAAERFDNSSPTDLAAGVLK